MIFSTIDKLTDSLLFGFKVKNIIHKLVSAAGGIVEMPALVNRAAIDICLY